MHLCLCPMTSVPRWCQYLLIVHSWLSLCLRYVSCIPNSVSVSWLSMRLRSVSCVPKWCQCLLIVYYWLSLCLRPVSCVPKWCQCFLIVPLSSFCVWCTQMVSVSLDCPFLIVPLCSFCVLCGQMVSVSLDCTCVFWGYQRGNREQ